jgi:hypothetical protein
VLSKLQKYMLEQLLHQFLRKLTQIKVQTDV